MKRIIILHGWTYNLDKWHVFEKKLGKVGYSVEILKIPGLTQKNEEVWDLDKYENWLEKRMEKERKKIILLGHSNGGRLAITYSVKNPGKIEKLILVDSAGIYHKGLNQEIKRFLFKAIAKVGKKITSSPAAKKFLYIMARENDYLNASTSAKKTMLNLINIDFTPLLRKIKIPTLIIWGELDEATPLKDGHLMNALIKNSKLVVVKGARHSPFYTHTEKVVKIINDAL